MVKSPSRPGGTPIEVFDDFRKQLASNRAEFYRAIASGPFYGDNRAGVRASEAVIENWYRRVSRLSVKLLGNGTLKLYKG